MDNFAVTSSLVATPSKKNLISKKDSTLSTIIKEYRLTQNNFNPDKRSPPNVFLNKLQQRMSYYYRNNQQEQNKSTLFTMK